MKASRLAFAAALVPLFLIGCQSTGVISTGNDTYMVGKKDGTPGLGVSLENKADVYREANAFCQKKGLDLRVISETVTPARPAQLGATELQFKCAPVETMHITAQ